MKTQKSQLKWQRPQRLNKMQRSEVQKSQTQKSQLKTKAEIKIQKLQIHIKIMIIYKTLYKKVTVERVMVQ